MDPYFTTVGAQYVASVTFKLTPTSSYGSPDPLIVAIDFSLPVTVHNVSDMNLH